MTVFDSFINLLQSGMITAFLIHCLGIKRKFQKKAAILVFVTVFFVYLEIQTFFTPFENYGVLLTLLVTGVLSFVFCEKGWIEKCICNVVILMFSVAAAIISGSIAGLIWNVGYVELVEGASAQKMAAMLFTQLLLGIFIGTFIRFQDILIDTYDLKFTLGVLSVPLISIVVVTAILSQPVTGRRDILQAGLITGGMIVVNLIVFIMMNTIRFTTIIPPVIVVNLIVFIMMKYENKQYRERLKSELLIRSYEQQKADIEEINQRYRMTQKNRHEMKRVLNLIQDYLQNGEQEKALSYLSELNVEEHIMSEQILYTKNSVLNYMLNRNISRCKEKGIDVKCMVTGSIDGIPDRDVYILAGNLFENAVEAACQAENPYISITICGNDTCLYFEFYNSTKENVMQTNPQLKTTKTEKAVHGYGIENVREIVKKYHGTIEYRSEGDSLFVCKTVLIKENVEL